MLVRKESIVGQLCLCGLLLTKPPVSYGRCKSPVDSSRWYATGWRIGDGNMSVQWEGNRRGNIVSTVQCYVTRKTVLLCTLDTFTPNYAAITAIYLAVMANIQLHCCMSLWRIENAFTILHYSPSLMLKSIEYRIIRRRTLSSLEDIKYAFWN